MKDKRIGIIGLGVIGQGLAKLFFQKEAQIFIRTGHPEKIEQFIFSMERDYQKKARRGKITGQDLKERLNKIHYVEKMDELEAMDLIVEAVKEDMAVKKQTLLEIKSIHIKQTLVATTTSSYSINELGGMLGEHVKFLGLHFFNPIGIMNLVEIIPAASTPPETICRAVELCRKINKTPIVVKDSCGFLVNRIFARYMDEACRMLESAAGDILKIDLELSHNLMLKGPYHIADFIGLDVLLKTNENLYRYYSGGKDNKFRVAQSLVELCKRGRYGCKVGRGYYSYAKPGAEAEIDEELTEILKEIQKNSSLSYVPINKEIALLAMINEAFLCLEEGIVRGADNIDLAMKYGFGMFEGPIGLARQIGIKRIYKRLDDLRDQYGERFSPAPLLKDFA